MTTKVVHGVRVEADFEATEKEIEAYIQDVIKKTACKLSELVSLKLNLKNDDVEIDYEIYHKGFERIRRIN